MTTWKVELQQIKRLLVALAEKSRLHAEKAASEFAKIEARISANEQHQQQMCERRLFQIASNIEEHQEKERLSVVENTLHVSHSRLDDSSTQHGDTLDEFCIRHEEHQQPAKAVQETCERRLSGLESNLRGHQLEFEQGGLDQKLCSKHLSMCEWRLSQLESDFQKHQEKLEQRLSDVEHRRQEDGDRLLELGKHHDEHQQHARYFNKMCEWRLAQLAGDFQEHQEKLDEVDVRQGLFLEQVSSRVVNLITQHSDRLDELGKRHDEHQQHAKHFKEMCERRLSQLEGDIQEHREKLDELDVDQASYVGQLFSRIDKEACERRVSQLDIGKQEHRVKLDEVDVYQASFQEKVSSRVDDLITQHSDRLDELGKRHDEHQQHTQVFNEMCERQLSQLEISKRLHQEKLEEVDLDQASFLKHLAVVQDTMQEFLMT
mmetsp:Transcript_1368/g.2510  ORF Transcript_1368/g.2510 Transcript_1368/m.2510 type:complete len:432 (-) Transcript_1368:311-1606(-)